MIPPRGFKSELFPLRHEFFYSVGLNLTTGPTNSTIFTIAKNYNAVNNADTITTNPHNANFDVETGAICNKMSILEKISLSMSFTLTEDAIVDGVKSAKVIYMPIFNSFKGRMESTDDVTSITPLTVLELIKDDTQEDVTPLFSTKLKKDAVPIVSLPHPVSTVNFTEVFGTLNLTTDVDMEGVSFFNESFHKAIKYYTNKGAINSMHGFMRSVNLTDTHPTKRIFIKKFVPRDVRRIVPYSYFGMLIHVPQVEASEQNYISGAVGGTKPHIGVKMRVNYNEWNVDHIQEMTTT